MDIQPGNFFENIPTAEVLILKNVLHDWNDEKCQIILNRCSQAMKSFARLLIVERVIASPADLMGAFYDLRMQMVLGGKERSENEFSRLLDKEGIKLNRIIPTKSQMKIIEA